MTLLARLEAFIEQHGNKHWSFAARKDASFYAEVMRLTEGLDIPFASRVYAAAHGQSPICDKGGLRSLNSITAGWRFCGRAGSCACAKESVSAKVKASDHSARLEKTRETLQTRYGVSNPTHLSQTREAHQRFYADHDKVNQSTEKYRETMLARHGVDNALKLPIDRKWVAQSHLSEETRHILNDAETFAQFVDGKSSTLVSSLLGMDVTTVNKYIRAYGVTRNLGSSYEDEIASFLNENHVSFVSQDRSVIAPQELDFYLPDHKLAIEFNGLYWHSDQVVDKLYHRSKWEACSAAGVRLLMINEDEWVARSSVLKAKILNLCGLSERGVGGRLLEARQVPNVDALAFCDLYHIQGHPGACVASYGAFRGISMVGVITLSRQRGTGVLDLNRFCTDGKTYAGLFSKLMKRIRQDYAEPIVTFADLRYSDGGLYERCGFERVGTIPPDYRYVKRGLTFHKSLFTKARIAKKFGMDMTGLTERAAMQEMGYSRIYDCGKIKYISR